MASFLFLCAAVVVIQTGIYIPLFSDIFSPQSSYSAFTGPYITSVTTTSTIVNEPIGGGMYKDFRYLHIYVTANPKFKDFDSVYIQLYTTSGAIVSHGHSLIKKEDLSSSHSAVRFEMDEPETNYQIKIFCSTDNPSQFEGFETFVRDEITYFLIYTHDSFVNII